MSPRPTLPPTLRAADPTPAAGPLTGVLTETAAIDVSDGTKMGAYLARPGHEGSGGAVIVVGELFGVSAHVRDVCERLATLGHRALAPDLNHRAAPGVELPHDTAGREQGLALLARMTRAGALADIRACRAWLSSGAEPVGILGLSVGGHVAYLAATEMTFAAVAVLYGGWLIGTEIPLSQPEPTITGTGRIASPMLVLVGADDHIVETTQQRAIAEALAGAGVSHELVVYPGTPHGFLCDRRESYHPESAADAWRRIAALFAGTLGGSAEVSLGALGPGPAKRR